MSDFFGQATSSNSRQWLDLGGAQYYFYIGLNGEIRTAQLIVRKNKSYTLPSGVYFLTSLEVEEGAKLTVSGPVTIFLYSNQSTHGVRLEKDASINKNGTPRNFSLLGFNKYIRNIPLPMIEMFERNQLNGTILAPYYQFIIREGIRLEGALLVHNFYMWPKIQPIPPRWEIIYGGPFCSATITVSLDGNGDFDSIQAAIAWAENGDVIIVRPGVYYEDINFFGKAITVKSEDPDDPNVVAATIIDGSQNGSVVTFNNGEGSISMLAGFTIQNGDSWHGGGIFCEGASPTIMNNVITNNTASSLTITPSSGGGGIYCIDSLAFIVNNLITNNYVRGLGGGIYCDSAVIINNTIVDNFSDAANFQSCIGGIYCEGASLIKNTIIWGNGGHHSPQQINEGVNIIYSDIEGGYVGEGNISANPSFVNPSVGGYHFEYISPCIDRGTNENCPTKDKDGVLRPQDGDYDGMAICDMGAYEYNMGYLNHPPVLALIGPKEVEAGNLFEFTLTATDPDEDILTYSVNNLPLGADFDPNRQKFNWKPNYNQAGSYEVTFTVTDNGTPPLSASETITIKVINKRRASDYGYGWYYGLYKQGYEYWNLINYQQQLWNNQLLSNWFQPTLHQWPTLSPSWQQQQQHPLYQPYDFQSYKPSFSQLYPLPQPQYQHRHFSDYQQQLWNVQKTWEQPIFQLEQYLPNLSWPRDKQEQQYWAPPLARDFSGYQQQVFDLQKQQQLFNLQ